jgi:hypothetical protein
VNARIRRLVIVLALASSAFAGAQLASAASDQELATRAGLTACVLRDEALHLGLDPRTAIPETNRACARFLFGLHVSRGSTSK